MCRTGAVRRSPRRVVPRGGRDVLRLAAVTAVCCVFVGAVLATFHRFPPGLRLAIGGIWLGPLMGIVEDDGVDRLIGKINRVEAGETDVTFETDRDDDLGPLYDAVGDLAECVPENTSEAAENEHATAESEHYRQHLYEITSDPSLRDEEKVEELLELGRERLGVANGLVTRIDREMGEYEVETAVGTAFVEAGTTTGLPNTFCRRTIDTDEDVLAIYDAATEGYEDDPAYAEWDINCYIGGKVLVDDEIYGTICFVDPDPCTESFTHEEKTFVDLISRWISHVYERRAREREITETNERLSALIDASPAAIVSIDLDGTVQLWNAAAERIFGWSAKEVRGEALPIVPEDYEGEYGQFRERLASGERLQRYETVRETRDGELLDVTLSAAPIHEDGEVVGVVGVFEDVTDQKAAERALRETRDRLSAVVEASPEAIIVLDTESRVQIWNPAAERTFGWSAEEVRGDVLPIIPDDMADDHREIEERMREGENLTGVETRRQTKDGELIDVRLSGGPIHDAEGTVVGTMGILEDVSEHKATRRELRETKRKLEIALEATDTGVWESTRGADEVHWNETYERLVGLEPGEFEGTVDAFMRRVHPDDARKIENEIEHADEHGTLPEHEFRLQRTDGSWMWVAARGQVLPQENGSDRLLGTVHDVTDRKEREIELERYREFTDDLLDAIDDVFYVLDEDGRVQRYNETMVEVTGYDEDELEGMHATEFFAGEGVERVERAIDEVAETGEARVEADYVTADGEHIPYEFVAVALEDLDGNPIAVGVGRDVSERYEKERQLARLIDNVPGFVYRVRNEPDWPTEFISEGIAEITGYDAEALEDGEVSFGSDIIGDANDRVWADVQAALERSEPFEVTYPIETADGERRWVKENGRGVYAEDGSVEALEGVVIDVTDRVQNEQELERTQRLLEQSQRLAQVGAWEVVIEDGEPVEGYMAEEVYRIYELEPGTEITVEEGFDLYHTADKERIRSAIERAIDDREPYDIEARLTTAEDNRRWVRTIGEPVVEDGDVVRVRGSIQDITERKERERTLERTTDLLELAQEMADVGGWSVDMTVEPPRQAEWSDRLYEIFEFPLDEAPPTADIYEYYHPDDREWHREAVEESIKTGGTWDQELRLITESGTQRWVHNIGETVVEDSRTVEIRGSIQDINQRKERERALERTTDLLERAEEMADVGGWLLDVSGEPPFQAEWTDKLYEIFELPPDETPPTADVFEYYHPDDRERHENAVETAMETGGSWDQELRLITESGTQRWVHNMGETVVEDGEVVEIRGTIQDITDRREREAQLRERERELQAHKDYTDDILDAIEDIFYVVDLEGTFQRWNQTQLDVSGYTAEEIAERNAFEFFREEDHDQIYAAIDAVTGAAGSRRVEAPLITRDGEEIPYEFIATTVENPEGETVIVGIGRDITERKRREEALERTTELLGQAQRLASIGGWEFDLESEELTVTDEFRRLHGLDPDEPVSLECVLSRYHPDDVEYIRQTFDEAVESGTSWDMEVRLQPGAEQTRWVRALGEPIVEDGDVVGIRGSIQDITEAKEREEALRALHETAEALLQIESASEIADLVVETADDVLDVAGICLFHLDEATNRLVPSACTPQFEGPAGEVAPVAVGDEDSPIWNSFATGTRQVLDEGDDAAGLFADRVGGALVVPIGDHGVLAVTTTQPGIGARTRQLVETLVATTEAALDRLESEAAVRQRDEALAERNRRLRRQIQLTDVIRRVDQSLIGADSREAVEAAVTEELAGADDISFAWIGRPDSAGERLVPQAWAGSGESYLDAVSLVLGDGDLEPAARTASSGEPTAVSNVVAELRGEGWRKPALDSGFASVLAVPIELDEYSHGVLAVYADEPEAFEDLEQEVFAELGRTIASAINSVQTRETLHADRLLELRLDFDESETVLAQIARAADCPVEYVGTAGRTEDVTRLFFAGECDVSDALADLVTVAEYRLLSETDDRFVYEVAVSGDALPAKLLRHGASPESIRATPSGLSVEVYVPPGTDVREFVEMLQESYRSVELASRKTVERPTRTRQQVVGDLLGDLTDRQREVLRTAYYAGFFDWPRGSTGEELAEMLGITQPTVSRHLRLGQKRLLAQLFEEDVVPAAA